MADHGARDEVRIARSVAGLVGLLAGALGFAAVSLAIGEGWIVLRRDGPVSIVMGWFGFLFSGIAALVALRRLVFGPRFPVRLRSTGILDRRQFRSEIPWTDVTDVTITPVNWWGGAQLMLTLSAEGLRRLDWNGSYRVFGRLGLLMQIDRIHIPTIDLKTSPSRLEAEIRRFLADVTPPAPQ
ncbi:hypothetical protein [Paragemmobacter ruber]|uniref:PH domain-containing protein n=1 Tax=Paragemmobacter ruber TaxID=1985673 RepID=A0ABW9Y8A3_9RHOB|nr:hypothetical protein [Rhodobacter ruber]NBE08822.1 hypothetical protein [Rhodobacter ruber]